MFVYTVLLRRNNFIRNSAKKRRTVNGNKTSIYLCAIIHRKDFDMVVPDKMLDNTLQIGTLVPDCSKF